VAHGEASAHHIVDRDGGEAAVFGDAVDEHDGSAAPTQAVEVGRLFGERRDQHAVHPLLLEEVEVRALALGLLVAVAEQDGHALLGGAVLGATSHVGEERVAHVEHDESDRPAATRPQLACGVVPHEAELLDGGEHSRDGGRRDLVGAVQHVRDRADGHGCRSGHVSHTHCHLLPLCVRRSARPSLP
jgi:hypothetical protein